ncbi:MAG: MBL fold metallo-hydrolase [Methanosarcinaceae archaeon]
MKMPISIKFFQPSWFQIKAENKIIYIDPAYLRKYYINYPKKIDFTTWPDPIDGLPDKNLEKADLILITHHHKDHCKAVTVNRLKKSNTIIIAPEICCKELGKNIKTIKPGENLKVGKIEVKATFAYNTKEGSSTKKVHEKGKCVGYLIKINGKTIYHAGDTDFIPEMKKFGKVDIALLPIGGTFTMDIPEATKTAIIIKPKIVIPMHNLKSNPQKFKEKLEAKSKIKVILLKIGETYYLN